MNVVDSRHHSQVYCQRLEKYAYRHGMAIGVPGFRPELATEKILPEKYVYVQDRELLVKIDQYGMPSGGRATASLLDKTTTLQYAMAHRCSVVDGLNGSWSGMATTKARSRYDTPTRPRCVQTIDRVEGKRRRTRSS